MNFLAKYLLLLIVLISSGSLVFAQDSSKATKATGEIIMTKAQLQSFIRTIAKLKKQQMAQDEGDKLLQMKLKYEKYKRPYTIEDGQTRNNFPESKLRWGSNSTQQYNPSYEERLFTQLELINARLNSVMSEIELLKIKASLNNPTASFSPASMRNSNPQQPQVRVEPKIQPVIINQEAPSQPYVNPVVQLNPPINLKNNPRELPAIQPADSVLLARQKNQLLLNNRIESLEEELILLQGLLKGSDEEEKNKYNENISNLTSQIDSLSMQLAQNSRKADSLKLEKQNSLSNTLKDFSYNIYFENNSTQIPSSDYSKLLEIVNMAKQHPQVPIVLRGFASKAGKPQYNEKISFQRAANVKEWLLDNGLHVKDIVTMSHGVDKSVDASQARRVEITFRAQ